MIRKQNTSEHPAIATIASEQFDALSIAKGKAENKAENKSINWEQWAPQVRLWPSHTCFITELKKELLSLTTQLPIDWSEVCIVLPTQRLANWLLLQLATTHAAFFPPVICNFDGFIDHLLDSYQLKDLKRDGPLLRDSGLISAVISSVENELILAHLIKSGNYQHIAIGHEHEISQIFSEFELAGFTLDQPESAFTILHEILRQNIFRSDSMIQSLHNRTDELQRLYLSYHEYLFTHSLTTSSRYAAQAGTLLGEHLETHLWGSRSGSDTLPWKHLYLVGFTSFAGVYKNLLQRMAQHSSVQFWFNEPPKIFQKETPLTKLLTWFAEPTSLDKQETLLTTEFQADVTGLQESPHVAVTHCENIVDEVKTVVAKLEMLTQSQQNTHARIGVLLADDKQYSPLLKTELKGTPLRYNMAVTTPLAQTLIGSWLSCFFHLAKGEDTFAVILDFLTHPVSWYRAATLSEEYQQAEAFVVRLTEELCEAHLVRGLKQLAAHSSSLNFSQRAVQALLQEINPFCLAKAHEARSFAEWVQQFHNLLAAFDLAATDLTRALPFESVMGEFIEQDPQSAHLESAALDVLRQFLDELSSTARRTQIVMTKAQFLHMIEEKLMRSDVRGVGEQLAGIQILSIEEARYVPFDYLFILGGCEGILPHPLPKDTLLDNYLKVQMGLPGWQFLEAIEVTTFTLLLERSKHLDISYPMQLQGQQMQPSRFIDYMRQKSSFKEYYSKDILAVREQAKFALPDETISGPLQERFANFYQPPSEVLNALSSQSSVSAIQTMIQCPYRFLLQRLKVKSLELPNIEDAQIEGDWLHSVLESFYTGKVRNKQHFDPLPHPNSIMDFRAFAVKRLVALTTLIAPSYVKETPLFLHLQTKSWPAFAKHIWQLAKHFPNWNMQKSQRELRFRISVEQLFAQGQVNRTDGPDLIDLDHKTHVTGVIDCFEDLGEMILLVDYKRRSTPSRRDFQLGLAPQLGFYALALQERTRSDLSDLMSQLVLGYWSIMKGEWIGMASGVSALAFAKKAGLIGVKSKSHIEESIQNMQKTWQWRRDNHFIKEQPFYPDDSHCQMCDFASICRKNEHGLQESVAHFAFEKLAERVSK